MEQHMGEWAQDRKWTLIEFTDGATLRVWWDGHHEVQWRADHQITIYRAGGLITAIPWHRVAAIHHQGDKSSD